MKMFALEHEVRQLESALLPLRGVARLPLLILLSWHLRQRNCVRSKMLSEEARALLLLGGLTSEAQAQAGARLQLVQAELLWLRGELDAAEALAMKAYTALDALGDGAGCADVHWLLSSIAIDRGDHAACDAHLQATGIQARSASDT